LKYLIISHILLISLLYSSDKVILFNNTEELVQWHDEQLLSEDNEKFTIDIHSMDVVEVVAPKKLVIVNDQEVDESSVISLPNATIVSVEEVVDEYNKDTLYTESLPLATIVEEDIDKISDEIESLPFATIIEEKVDKTSVALESLPLATIVEEKINKLSDSKLDDLLVETNPKEVLDTKSSLDIITSEENKIQGNTPIVITNHYGDELSVDVDIDIDKAKSESIIEFWELLDLALVKATAQILKKHDIKITKENMELVKSEYYPNISLIYSGEYYNGYNRNSSATIGGSFYPGIKQFRDSFSLSLNYELYRFGATDLKVKISEKDIEIIKSELTLQEEQISKELLGYYANALRAQDIIKYKGKIRFVQDRIIQKKWRLFEVGQMTKIELSKDQLSLVSLEKEISKQKMDFLKAVKSIQILTNITIDSSNVKFAMLEPKNSEIKIFEESAVANNLKLNLEKKLQELELIKKDYMPTLYASSGYRFYGDGSGFVTAFENIEKNSWDIGINLRWDIFNGYKTDKTVGKLKLEVQKLAEQYRLAKVDFEAKELKSKLLKESINKMLHIESEILSQTHEQGKMLSRLQDVGQVDSIQLDQIEIKKLQSELDFRLGVTERVYESISSELII